MLGILPHFSAIYIRPFNENKRPLSVTTVLRADELQGRKFCVTQRVIYGLRYVVFVKGPLECAHWEWNRVQVLEES